MQLDAKNAIIRWGEGEKNLCFSEEARVKLGYYAALWKRVQFHDTRNNFSCGKSFFFFFSRVKLKYRCVLRVINHRIYTRFDLDNFFFFFFSTRVSSSSRKIFIIYTLALLLPCSPPLSLEKFFLLRGRAFWWCPKINTFSN